MPLHQRIHIHLGDGPSVKRRERNMRISLVLLAVVLVAGFVTVSLRVCLYGLSPQVAQSILAVSVPVHNARSRPDILDRNGQILATDIRVFWLHADPQHVVNADETAEKLLRLFPDLDAPALHAKLRAKSRFEWVKRGLTPRQAELVYALGLPGLHLIPENQRVYPAGHAAAHVLGITNIDNVGLSGVERYIDQRPPAQFLNVSPGHRPFIKLSIDLGVQHAFAEELAKAKREYNAQAAFGVVMDVRNGEVIASVSLPDFDPNQRDQAISADRQNRVLTDTYELGSVFKAFTTALALDAGFVRREDRIDTGTPLNVGRFILRDKHGERKMSVEEIFTRSSNTGTARLALMAGIPRQRAFLEALGLLTPLATEAGSSAPPAQPRTWRPANAVTISYGHGIAVPPLSFAAAAAAMVNGGTLVRPTFMLSTARAGAGPRVISPETSADMRDLLRLTVERGTGKRAAVSGVAVGGKTGTAQKVKRGRYSKDVVTTFFAAFPIAAPRYLVLVSFDEPRPTERTPRTEAAYNAAPAAGAAIARIAPMLGVTAFAQIDEPEPTSY